MGALGEVHIKQGDKIIFRHGDRTPTNLLPSDKRGESIWPNGLEQLTKRGIQQEYELGQYFRKTYDGFLNQTYVADEISTLSTDKDRALMSAYSVLAGLYPPVDNQKWGTDKNIQLGQLWQPLPVKSTDYNTNPLLSADVPCPRFNRLYQEVLQSPEAINLTVQNQLLSTHVPCPVYDDLLQKQLNRAETKALNKQFKLLIDYVIKEGGWSESNLDNVFDTYDILKIMKLYNVEPDWAHKDRELLEELEHFKLRHYDLRYKTEHMIKIKAGTFLNEILKNTNSWINGEMNPKKKMMLYSSHDSVIGALMFALDIWNDILPPYGCSIIFELHEHPAGEYKMHVLFKNDTVTNAVNGTAFPMSLPDVHCGPECPISAFRELISPLVLENYEQECQKNSPHSTTIVAGCVIGAIFIIVVIGLFIWCRKKKTQNFNYRSANFSEDPEVFA